MYVCIYVMGVFTRVQEPVETGSIRAPEAVVTGSCDLIQYGC